MPASTASSFLSPPSHVSASAARAPSVKKRTHGQLTDRRMAATPFPRSTKSVMSLFSPMTENSFTYEAYQEFLVQSYFISEKSRVMARRQGEGESDGHKFQFERDVDRYLGFKRQSELQRIKEIYEEHKDEVERIRYWLLQLVGINSSEMIGLVLEGLSLTPQGLKQCDNKKLDVIAEDLISQIGNQLHSFDASLRQQVFQKIGASYDEKDANIPLEDQIKETQCRSSAERILIQAARRVLFDNNLVQFQSSPWHRLTAVRLFMLAFLGLAVGASLHFMPVVGAALALTMVVEWLALLINIALPAVALGLTFSLVPVIFVCCQKKTPLPSGFRVDLADTIDGPGFGGSSVSIGAKALFFSSCLLAQASAAKVEASGAPSPTAAGEPEKQPTEDSVYVADDGDAPCGCVLSLAALS